MAHLLRNDVGRFAQHIRGVKGGKKGKSYPRPRILSGSVLRNFNNTSCWKLTSLDIKAAFARLIIKKKSTTWKCKPAASGWQERS